jgi:hypothetical protein
VILQKPSSSFEADNGRFFLTIALFPSAKHTENGKQCVAKWVWRLIALGSAHDS